MSGDSTLLPPLPPPPPAGLGREWVMGSGSTCDMPFSARSPSSEPSSTVRSSIMSCGSIFSWSACCCACCTAIATCCALKARKESATAPPCTSSEASGGDVSDVSGRTHTNGLSAHCPTTASDCSSRRTSADSLAISWRIAASRGETWKRPSCVLVEPRGVELILNDGLFVGLAQKTSRPERSSHRNRGKTARQTRSRILPPLPADAKAGAAAVPHPRSSFFQARKREVGGSTQPRNRPALPRSRCLFRKRTRSSSDSDRVGFPSTSRTRNQATEDDDHFPCLFVGCAALPFAPSGSLLSLPRGRDGRGARLCYYY